jgi:hypothetical protein
VASVDQDSPGDPREPAQSLLRSDEILSLARKVRDVLAAS